MIDPLILRNSYVFQECTGAELARLSPYFSRARYRTNQPVYCEGDPADAIYFIQSGSVELTVPLGNGEAGHISILPPNDVFGIGEVFFPVYYLNAVSLADSVLYRMPKGDFFGRFITLPPLNRFIIQSFAEIIRNKTIKTEWHSPREKVENFLYMMCLEHGAVQKDGVSIGLFFTHQKIAEALDLTREYITRTINQMKKEGVILKGGKTLLVSGGWFRAMKEKVKLDAGSLKRMLKPM